MSEHQAPQSEPRTQRGLSSAVDAPRGVLAVSVRSQAQAPSGGGGGGAMSTAARATVASAAHSRVHVRRLRR